uniref:Putative secreted protein n=1 Tax=Ixodes ricinus TaxID=34613 RepID=A0A6B0U9D3_IXORI
MERCAEPSLLTLMLATSAESSSSSRTHSLANRAASQSGWPSALSYTSKQTELWPAALATCFCHFAGTGVPSGKTGTKLPSGIPLM